MNRYTKARPEEAPNQRERNNLQLAYRAACEAIVLLKNDGSLPLKTKKIALYGAGALKTVKGGTGSGEVNERHSVTIAEGLVDRGFSVTTEQWLQDYEADFPSAKAALRHRNKKLHNIFSMDDWMCLLAEDSCLPCGRPITAEDVVRSDTDSCIYVLSRQAGEGGDRKTEKGELYLTDEELEAIRFCAEQYAHFILVINCGSSMDLSFAEEIPGINAILYICQPGTEGGNAFADVVSGRVCPSGKLSDTWAKRYTDIPFAMEYSHLNGQLQEEYYKEGIYVGYRYFDSFGVEPAYPFGFGMSYTDFSIHSTGVRLEGSRLQLGVRVTNTGPEFSGKEVAQLYVSAPEGQLHKEYQSLAAFRKTDTLAPGQHQELTLTFDMKQLASFREEDNCFVLEQGDYILRLGNSSRSTVPVAVVTLPECCVVSRHDPICPLREPLQELVAPQRQPETLHPGLPRLRMEPNAIRTATFDYSQEPPQDEEACRFVSGLTAKEMARIVVGIGQMGGKRIFDLPGSVGNTTSYFWDRGLANVALCDGPAGLRIQSHSAMTRKGKIKPMKLSMSLFEMIPGFIKKGMLGNPKKDTLLYQFTTAFPVENALAQTWNVPLMEQIGDAIYREMQEYGCTFWLAPAVNIHRNPLCGRNFEYFSEDPLLTGAMAAAITRGVQQEEGYYVTVKHFACNNQENNRMKVSSNVSQRALREIYLRAFEAAVRQGGAKSIMTSYNRINGVYAPNSHDLCTKVLRREWGFDGVVMTDWYSTSAGKGDDALAMQAGNDLIMPGGLYHRHKILRGIRSGKISEADLRRCCIHVVTSILHSPTQREYLNAEKQR